MSGECREMRELIQAALDAELTASQRDALESHVATCASCAAEFAALKLAVSALSDLPCPVPAGDFARTVLARVATIQTNRLRLRRRLAWLAASLGLSIAAAMAAVWVAFWGPVWDAAADLTRIIPALAHPVTDAAIAIGRGLIPIGAAMAKISSPGVNTVATYYGIALGVLLLIVAATRGGRRFARIRILAF